MKHLKRALVLLMLPLLAACSGVTLKSDVVEMELGADVFANPRLYVQDGQELDVEKADVYTTSPGVMKTRNRFVTSGQSYLQIGEYDFVLEYKGRNYPFTLKIKDTTAPTCAKTPQVADVYVGATIDWDDIFGARDLSGVYYECPQLTNNIAAEGTVEVKISDRFGNSITRTVYLNPVL